MVDNQSRGLHTGAGNQASATAHRKEGWQGGARARGGGGGGAVHRLRQDLWNRCSLGDVIQQKATQQNII